MTTATNKDGTTETNVLEANNILSNKIRHALIDKFPDLWFYLYKENSKGNALITVANSFGGKLDKNTCVEVIAFAKELHSQLKILR